MADLCIQFNEEMVGKGHPVKADTLNRLSLVEHNNDGTHADVTAASFSVAGGILIDVTHPVYGAAGDGVTDDSAAIQAAVNAGRYVHFPYGRTFLCKSKITVPHNKGRIKLSGYGASIKGHADLASDYIFEFTGDVANQNYNNVVEGFDVDLNGAKGFVHFNKGVHTSKVEDVYIRDTAFATSTNTVGVRILNSFNIIIDNVRVHKLNGSSGVGVQIVSDSSVAGFDNITNIGIYNCVLQRSWKNIDMSFETGADTVRIVNTALGDDSTPLGQYGLYISGVVHNLTFDGNHVEHVPTGVYINGSEYSGSIVNCLFYNVADCYSFNGAAGWADISLMRNRYYGTAHTPKYDIFSVNNASITLLDRLRFNSTTYTEAVGSGTGTIRNNARVTVAKTADYALFAVDERRTFTNNGAAGEVTFTLPACSSVGDGFEVTFIVIASHIIYIAPDGADRIVPLTDADGDRISAGTSGDTITLVSRSTGGACRWYVIGCNGTWTDAD